MLTYGGNRVGDRRHPSGGNGGGGDCIDGSVLRRACLKLLGYSTCNVAGAWTAAVTVVMNTTNRDMSTTVLAPMKGDNKTN